MLARGTRLGPYEIVEPLGSGGMGDVYRARDERLSREVALKMISLKALDSPGSRRRFELEAKTLAGINHANLVSVYDVGVEPDQPFLITELINGDSLRQVLRKSRVSLGKVLDIAIQIAAGLTAAHEAGIVHRDLKPENIMLTRDSVVKLIDFGLAKHAPIDSPSVDDLTASLVTEPGMILGTVGYMSPEQCSGLPVDFRSDQFSFGCIVYELLTGEKAYTGKTKIETLTAVLHKDPARLSAEELGVSTSMLWILKRCLAKDPARRFAATRDLYLDLEAARTQTEPVPTAPRRARIRWARVLVIAALAVTAASALIALWPSSEVIPKLTPVAIDAAIEREPKWSPDGHTLLYLREVNGILQVFTKNIASSAAAQITHSDKDCSGQFWSSDGTHIYYTTSAAGPRAVVTSPLWAVSVIGGQPEMMEPNVRAGAASPDGKLFAFLKGGIGDASLWLRQRTGAPQRYTRGPFSQPMWVTLRLAFSPDSKKLAVVWAASGLQSSEPALWIIPMPEGVPYVVPMPPNIGIVGTGLTWLPDSLHVSFGSYLPNQFGVHLVVLNTRTRAIRTLTSGTGHEADPDISSDGARIAFTTGGTDFDIVEFFTNGDKRRPLLATALNEDVAAWSPDGELFAYARSGAMGRYKLYSHTERGGWERPLLDPETQADPYSYRRPKFSPDGQRIAYERYGAEGHLIYVSFVSGTHPLRLDTESNDQHAPVWSPDGLWIAYRRQRKGAWELARVRSDTSGTPIRIPAEDILAGGGPLLDWSPSGEWLAYASTNALHLVSPDGQRQRVLVMNAPAVFGFSKTGMQMYGLRRGANNIWKTVVIDVKTGIEQELGTNELPPLANVTGFGLHPSGTRFVTSIGTSRDDIWMLEGFKKPKSWPASLLQRE